MPPRNDSSLYGESYFRNYWGSGGAYERNDRWLEFFGRVAEGLVRDFQPDTVFDAGCAIGLLVEQLVERGVDAEGADISEYAISQVPESIRDRCRVASLVEPLSKRYDLITCVEVVEHLPADEIHQALENLCGATDRLVLSTTPRDFGEPTHVNVQPAENWSAMLAQLGFLRNLDVDLSYLSPWAALYERRKETPIEIVRLYDRGWTRQRQEILEMRESLKASNARIADLEARLDSDFEEQTSALRMANLELRDTLIDRELEMGNIRGRMAQLEDQAGRFANIRERIQTKIPGFLMIVVMRFWHWMR